jgi:protocatechuate 3,4-dioxygenase beta subunit
MAARPFPLSRRTVSAALVALPALWTGGARSLTAPLRPTPSQTEGPFYPVALPKDADADLLRNGNLVYAKGEPATVHGIVQDTEGRPLSGAVVEIWQCDHAGHYHHPGDGGRADPQFQGFGRATVDAEGKYSFRTIRPVAYAGRTPHIHVKVRKDRRALLTTQLYVAGDPHNERDPIWRGLGDRRELVTVAFERHPEGLRALFGIVLAT